MARVMFSEIHQLLQIYLSVPMTRATAEHTFSAFRRLKNYLRSRMSEERLNHVMLMHTHKDRTDNLNLLEVAKDFSTFNDRRRPIHFFGHFD